ncbi:recombinase family protein [Alicyclobacillus acidoterrestris]|uniref:Recombinase family protein n=1 Tax=Alicyclobacillus acidoterrestris (strain ATCC 49025 / DSM 3922 / CIP 106132 / NCIMB 13137 / GD3B) TaxID=1356854 RepID=T0C413_ALIAG|nr:recombinase family protein [Alicyclobacillus acidoterrestris]EPZ47754.1 hypothetical protein N007_05730 [Alicyclobacillus acidoterrestris ATCC 49025]UNO47941.1 recombinase family protein [Alicyclobacillus acidoterrestris]
MPVCAIFGKDDYELQYAGLFAEHILDNSIPIDKYREYNRDVAVRYNLVVAKCMSRYVVNMRDEVTYLESHNVRVISIDDSYDTRQSNAPTQDVYRSYLAQFNAAKSSTVIRSGLLQTIKQGKRPGRTPFGYKLNDAGQLEIDPTGAEIVREIYRLYIENDGGMKAVADILNEHGYKTKTNRRWSPSTIREILTNPVFIGVLTLGENLRIEHAHEPIVDYDTWEKVQKLIYAKRRNTTKRVSRKLLDDILWCGVCGNEMASEEDKYVCTNIKCPNIGIDRPELEWLVVERVKGYLARKYNKLSLQSYMRKVTDEETVKYITKVTEKLYVIERYSAINRYRKELHAVVERIEFTPYGNTWEMQICYKFGI